MSKIRVVIVDDSALIRKMLSSALELSGDIEVVGTASDPFVARDMIKQLNPDVITLDVEMPKMDGLSFLGNLMRLRPMPVVMVSTLTTKASDVTLSALEMGAVDYIAKPSANLKGDISEFAAEVQEKIRVAAKANVQQLQIKPKAAEKKSFVIPEAGSSSFQHIVAIGASTGGTEAIKEVLSRIPENCPPIVITQHIPPNFSTSFAKRLNSQCAMRVVEAVHHQPITAGTAYLAPGDHHLRVATVGGKLVCKLDGGEKVNRHRPSVDVLFDSVAENISRGKAIAVLLTGMGADGAKGMLKLREAGCFTIAQDEATSVVWGMPGAAVKLDAVDKVMPLNRIANHLMSLPKNKDSAKKQQA